MTAAGIIVAALVCLAVFWACVYAAPTIDRAEKDWLD